LGNWRIGGLDDCLPRPISGEVGAGVVRQPQRVQPGDANAVSWCRLVQLFPPPFGPVKQGTCRRAQPTEGCMKAEVRNCTFIEPQRRRRTPPCIAFSRRVPEDETLCWNRRRVWPMRLATATTGQTPPQPATKIELSVMRSLSPSDPPLITLDPFTHDHHHPSEPAEGSQSTDNPPVGTHLQPSTSNGDSSTGSGHPGARRGHHAVSAGR